MKTGTPGYWKLLIILSVLFIQSCATTYVTDIRPVGVNTFVESGRVVANQNKSGVEAYLTLLDNPPGMMLFDVQITNRTDYPVNIKPLDIFIVPMNSPADNISSASAVNVIKSINPKNELEKIDKEIADAKSGYTSSIILDIGLTLLGAAIYTAVEDDESPVVYADLAAGLIDRRVNASIDHDRFMGDLNYRKNFIATNSLKDSVINRDGHVYGAVMFPVNALPKYFKVVVPLNGTFFDFPYEVALIKQ